MPHFCQFTVFSSWPQTFKPRIFQWASSSSNFRTCWAADSQEAVIGGQNRHKKWKHAQVFPKPPCRHKYIPSCHFPFYKPPPAKSPRGSAPPEPRMTISFLRLINPQGRTRGMWHSRPTIVYNCSHRGDMVIHAPCRFGCSSLRLHWDLRPNRKEFFKI